MKTLLLLFLLVSNLNCVTTPVTYVYICDSFQGKKYHLKQTCKGLSTCQHKVVKITLDEAKKRGKTICALEK